MHLYYFARKVAAQEWQAINTPANIRCIYEQPDFLPPNIQPNNCYPALPATLTDEQCLQMIADFAHTQAQDGNPYIQHLTINGIVHWFYLRMSLYYRFRSILHATNRLNQTLHELNQTAHPVTALHFFCTEAVPHYVIETKAPILLHLPPPQQRRSAGSHTPIWFLLQYLILFVIRAFWGLWLWKRLPNTPPQNVLVTDPELLQNMINPQQTEQTITTDTYFCYLLEKVKTLPNFTILTEVQPPKLQNARRRRITTALIKPAYPNRTLHFEAFMLLSLLNPATYFYLFKAYRQLKNIPPPAASGATLATLLYHLLRQSFPLILQGVVRYKAANLFARTYNIRTICAPNEHAVTNKPLLDAVKQRGGTAIGMQHGALSVFYRCYSPADNAYAHLPQYTIFWGNKYLKSLAHNPQYHSQNSICLGQLRTDVIPALTHNFPKSSLSAQLTDDAPILLYLPQPLVGAETPLRRLLAAHFLALSHRFPHCKLVIKPHPLDTDYAFFETIAAQQGNAPYLLLNTDLYRLLAVSDVVITYHSTAGAEAVYFKKPLLIANYPGYTPDAAGYITAGVGLPFENESRLAQLVAAILNGNTAINAQNQTNFIKEHAVAIDGQTANRYLNFILNPTEIMSL